MRLDGTLEYDSSCSDDSCRHANVSPEAAANPGSSRRSRFRPWPSVEASDCTKIKKRSLTRDDELDISSLFSLIIQFYDFSPFYLIASFKELSLLKFYSLRPQQHSKVFARREI